MVDKAHSEGWITFSTVVLWTASAVNVVVGLAAMYDPVFSDRAPVLVGLYAWGVTLLAGGLAQAVAAVLLGRRSKLGRIAAMALASFSITMWAFWSGAYTTASMIAILLAVLVLYGLSVTKSSFTAE